MMKTAGETSSRLIFWCFMSVFSSVGIILINKTIMQTYGFKYVFTLTAFHFLFQAVVLEVLGNMGTFQVKRLENRDNVLTALVGVASIVFMNFNLRFNSVGFYQMSKLLCIPLMMLIQTKLYGKVFSSKLKFSLLVLLVGVGIAVVTDLEVNLIGTMFGAIAVASTTQFQIWQGTKQTQHGVSSIQLTHSVSMPMFVITALAALFFEVLSSQSVLYHHFKRGEEFKVFVAIFLSCLLAVSVNISSFTLIGISSPVTYQVVGHMKTVLVLLGGLLFFPITASLWQLSKNVTGIVIAMAGVFLYGHLKQVEGTDTQDALERYLPESVLELIEGKDKRRPVYKLVSDVDTRGA
jgi:solute carrier family 35 protein E3